MVDIPVLRWVDRDREYRSYTEKLRDKIVYEYLFKGVSHRLLDKDIIGIDSEYSRGWQSMGILHHLGLQNEHKGIFKGIDVVNAINILRDKDKIHYKNIIQCLIRYCNDIYSDESIELFNCSESTEKLYKDVGISQYTDGVRIEKEFHSIFNPPNSPFYVKRGTARKIKVLFNNKIFDAEYRYEGQTDTSIELQSIRFKKQLKDEFKKVFPNAAGKFIIQQGVDLRHFIFSIVYDSAVEDTDELEYPEGKEAYRTHKVRERNPKVIKKAKEKFKSRFGKLYCEICTFCFEDKYGDVGEDYIEGHHSIPVSEIPEDYKTKPEDIVLVCSNCHRMLHRKRPWLSKEQLKELIKY
jgi:Predicted restriction endonuclease